MKHLGNLIDTAKAEANAVNQLVPMGGNTGQPTCVSLGSNCSPCC